jgi:hypothetical protein
MRAMSEDAVVRDELRSAVAARRELGEEMVLGSMGIAVPLLGLAAAFTGLPGVIVVCIALVVIAVVSTRS